MLVSRSEVLMIQSLVLTECKRFLKRWGLQHSPELHDIYHKPHQGTLVDRCSFQQPDCKFPFLHTGLLRSRLSLRRPWLLA